MTFFNFDDYRCYLREYFKIRPNKGRGEIGRMATFLGVNSTWISQILNGSKQFNLDQVIELGSYLELTDLEIDYFSLLVQSERAGHQKTKIYLQKKLDDLKSQSLSLSRQINLKRILDDEQKSIFYSSWHYSAIQLFTSTNVEGVTLEEIMTTFEIKRGRTLEILNFLERCQLVVNNGQRYQQGIQSTFIGRDSPHILKHHTNWRIRALIKAEQIENEEFMVTAPVSISRADYPKIRDELVATFKRISAIVKNSKPEQVANLNIDWFWVSR